MGISGATKPPAESVTDVKVWPVPWFSTATDAPGITEPEVSCTVPRMVPRSCCATQGKITHSAAKAKQAECNEERFGSVIGQVFLYLAKWWKAVYPRLPP